MSAEKAVLLRYLQSGREALLWKLDGLSGCDVRRPMTRTGTNLLGLVKHADVVRELVDGSAGLRPGVSNLPDVDDAWWAAYRERLEQVAREAAD